MLVTPSFYTFGMTLFLILLELLWTMLILIWLRHCSQMKCLNNTVFSPPFEHLYSSYDIVTTVTTATTLLHRLQQLQQLQHCYNIGTTLLQHCYNSYKIVTTLLEESKPINNQLKQ